MPERAHGATVRANRVRYAAACLLVAGMAAVRGFGAAGDPPWAVAARIVCAVSAVAGIGMFVAALRRH